jgi:hypothetical protein
MKTMYCAICGELAAIVEAGSKIKTGAVLICPKCWGEDKPAKEAPNYGDMPDFLKDIFSKKTY